MLNKSPSSVAVACFLPSWAKNSSAPPRRRIIQIALLAVKSHFDTYFVRIVTSGERFKLRCEQNIRRSSHLRHCHQILKQNTLLYTPLNKALHKTQLPTVLTDNCLFRNFNDFTHLLSFNYTKIEFITITQGFQIYLQKWDILSNSAF